MTMPHLMNEKFISLLLLDVSLRAAKEDVKRAENKAAKIKVKMAVKAAKKATKKAATLTIERTTEQDII